MELLEVNGVSLNLSPEEQQQAFLSSLQPKDGSCELWLKQDHNNFYVTDDWRQGKIRGFKTKLGERGNPQSRYRLKTPIPNLMKYLAQRCRERAGGVFYVPTQPQGLPTVDRVLSTDHIGIELDDLPAEAQIAKYQTFTQITGVEFALVLSSGGKSIHAHLKCDRHLPIDQAQYLRRLGVIAFMSDPVTERLHQPMRVPGFWRQEKDAYQTLLSYSDRRYSEADLIAAFRTWFGYQEWDFPVEMPDQMWDEIFFQIYRSGSGLDEAGKHQATTAALVEGPAAFLERRQRETRERQAERDRNRKIFQGTPGGDLVAAIAEAHQLAGPEAFYGIDWIFSGTGHARGPCRFHDSKSGTSAWISDQSDGWRFHCASCTQDQPRNAFEFHLAVQGKLDIGNPQLPTGKRWVTEAQDWLIAQGLPVPDFRPLPVSTNGSGSQVSVEENIDPDYRPRYETSPETGLCWVTFEPIKNFAGEIVDYRPVHTRVGDHLAALAYVDSPKQDGASLYLEFHDRKYQIRTVTISRELLAGDSSELLRKLNRLSYFHVRQQRNRLLDYLNQLGRECDREFIVTPRTGWHESSFVLTDRTYGDPNLRFGQVEPPPDITFEQRGTLEDWQRTIASQAINNSRLILALGCPFSGPLHPILGLESGGFHLFGATSTGKTTLLKAAASIYGPPSKVLRHWRTTANGLEGTAAAHHHLCLLLDEIGQVLPQDVAQSAYLLANGQGKTRMRRNTKVDPPLQWNLVFLSTGEISLQDYLAGARMTLKGGQENRMPSVPALPDQGHGVFEVTHQQDPQAFVRSIEINAEKYCGTAFDAFLGRLIQELGTPTFEKELVDRYAVVMNALAAIAPGDEVIGRVAQRFAAVQVALELAIRYEILPLDPGQAEWAIATCFQSWIDSRGGAGSIELKQALQRIEHLFVSNEHSDRICRLIKVKAGDQEQQIVDSGQIVRDLLAYRKGGHGDDEVEFWVPTTVFNQEFCQEVDRNLLIEELHARGWLKGPAADGKSTLPRRYEGKRQKFYVFRSFWTSYRDLDEKK